MYKNKTFLQIKLQLSIISFICNLLVNKTKKHVLVKYNYNCLMDFKLLVLC